MLKNDVIIDRRASAANFYAASKLQAAALCEHDQCAPFYCSAQPRQQQPSRTPPYTPSPRTRAWPEVATGCILRADFPQPIVELETSTGETPTVLSKDANPATVIPGPPQLCALKNDHDNDGKQRSVLTIATDLKYLRPWSHFPVEQALLLQAGGLGFLTVSGQRRHGPRAESEMPVR